MMCHYSLPRSKYRKWPVPDPDLEIRGGGEGTRSSRPLDKGGGGPISPKNFFGPQFALKTKGGGGACPSPGSATGGTSSV